jgi:hypothetical protein
MPTLVARPKYTSRTAAQIREDLLRAIPTLAPSWTSHGEDEPGIALVEMVAGVADGLHYYFDKQALETYLPTVRLRKNAMSLAHLVGYRPRRAYAAQGTMIIYPTQPLTEAVYIPAQTQFATRGGVPIVTLEDAYLAAGFSGTRTVRAVQGEKHVASFESAGGNEVAFTLPHKNPSEQLFIVSSYGRAWVEFRDSQPEDAVSRWYHYAEEYDGSVTVRFLRALGNVPMAGTPIDVTYLVSQDLSIPGATVINPPTLPAPAGLEGAALESYLENLTWLRYETGVLNNYRPKESVESLRVTAPISIKTKNRAVSEDDYRFLARQLGGVKDVKMGLSDFYSRQVVAYVLTETGQAADADLLEQVRVYLDARNDLTLDVAVNSAPTAEFRCTVEVKARLGYTAAKAVYDVKEALSAFFKTTAFNFGRTLRLGEVYSAANRLDSVDYVNISALYWDGEPVGAADLEPATELTVPIVASGGLVVTPVS